MLNKLPWSLMGTRVNPVTSIFGSAKPSVLNKPSYCVYHSKAAAYKSGSFIKYAGMCLNGTKVRHRNVRVVSKVTARPSKSHIFDRVMAHRRKSHILGSKISEYRKGCSIYALSLYGSTKSPLSSSRPSLRHPSKIIKPSGGFARRTFSVQSSPTSDLTGTSTSKYAFGKDGKGSTSSSKTFFNELRKTFDSHGIVDEKPDNAFPSHHVIGVVVVLNPD